MAAKDSESLEQRVREGAQEFNFGALLSRPPDTEMPESSDPMQRRFDSYLKLPQNAAVVERTAHPDWKATAGSRRALSGAVITLLGIFALGGWALYLRKPASQPANGALLASREVPAQPNAGERKIGLPHPELTPGERGTQSSADVPVPEDVRRQVFSAYGIDVNDPIHVPVRLIPSALGGTNGPNNVFPLTPWFAELKSRLDAFLVNQVRTGKMSQAQAEKALTGNWISACHRNYIRNYGESDAEKAREAEDRLRWVK